MKTLVAMLAALAVFGLAEEGHPWDGDRKGFVLGVGLGLGNTPFADIGFERVDVGGWMERRLVCEDTRKQLLVQDLRIGYAPDNHWQILWLTRLFWFKTTTYYCYNGYEEPDDELCATGLTGLAVTRAFNEKVPSPYVVGAVGLALLHRLPVDTWYRGTCGCIREDAEFGFGLMAGVGYELAQHVNMQLDLMYSAPSDVDGWNGLSMSIGIIVLGY